MRRGARWARRMGLGAAGALAAGIPAVAGTVAPGAVDAGLAWRDVLPQRAPVLPAPGDVEEAILLLADPPAADAAPGERAAAAAAISRRHDELAPVLAQLGAEVTGRYRILVNALAVRVPNGRLPAVAALADVEAVVPVTYLAPAAVGAADAGPAPGVARAVVPPPPASPAHVALIDTGIDTSHPWLGGGIGPTSPVIGGVDLVDADGDPTGTTEAEAHGTAMAGLVLRSPALAGLPPERVPRLLAYRVVEDVAVDGGTLPLARSDRVLAAMERAVDPDGDGDPDDRADVVLLGVSRGFGGGGTDPVERAARAADRLGAIVVAPAGNEGATGAATGSIGGPAAAPTVLTVGALGADTSPRTARLEVKVGPAGASLEPLPLVGPAPPPAAAPVVVVSGVDGIASGATREEYLGPDGASRVQGAIAVVGRGGATLAQKARAAAAAGAVA
ncbi:MAG: S8 family serine peptidase, partial [Actinomycetota bacterium]